MWFLLNFKALDNEIPEECENRHFDTEGWFFLGWSLKDIFWVILSIRWIWKKLWLCGTCKITKFESVIRIKQAPFLAALGSIFEQNLCVTREWLIIQARRRSKLPSCFSSNFTEGYDIFGKILLLSKSLKVPLSKGLFLRSFYRIQKKLYLGEGFWVLAVCGSAEFLDAKKCSDHGWKKKRMSPGCGRRLSALRPTDNDAQFFTMKYYV